MTTYIINNRTTALVPAKQIDYTTQIIEADKQFYVRETAQDIIEATCREDWSSYETRRNIITNRTNYIQKTPIPVNIQEEIIIFPTHSPNHHNCIWITLNKHVAIYHIAGKLKLSTDGTPDNTITLSASHHTITNQIARARHIKQLLQTPNKR